jgi:hypothetical protein
MRINKKRVITSEEVRRAHVQMYNLMHMGHKIFCFVKNFGCFFLNRSTFSGSAVCDLCLMTTLMISILCVENQMYVAQGGYSSYCWMDIHFGYSYRGLFVQITRARSGVWHHIFRSTLITI